MLESFDSPHSLSGTQFLSTAVSTTPAPVRHGGLAEIQPPAAAAECSPDRQVRGSRVVGDSKLRRSDGKGKDDWEPHFNPGSMVVPICLRMAATNLELRTLSPEFIGIIERRA